MASIFRPCSTAARTLSNTMSEDIELKLSRERMPAAIVSYACPVPPS